jgi:hypothetical protein
MPHKRTDGDADCIADFLADVAANISSDSVANSFAYNELHAAHEYDWLQHHSL